MRTSTLMTLAILGLCLLVPDLAVANKGPSVGPAQNNQTVELAKSIRSTYGIASKIALSGAKFRKCVQETKEEIENKFNQCIWKAQGDDAKSEKCGKKYRWRKGRVKTYCKVLTG